MANRNYDFQKAHKNKEARLRWIGVQPLICCTPARFHVQRGNRVWNALDKGMGIGRGLVR